MTERPAAADAIAPLRTGAATDIGPVRKENQDSFNVVESGDRTAVALADGMGGHTGGGEAATAAVDAASAALRDAQGRAVPAREAVRGAFSAAVSAVGRVRAEMGGMPGTTLVIALVDTAGHTVVGNIGDSRAYSVQNGTAAVITHDHSWVGEQVRAGTLQEDEIRRHPRRNLITRAVTGDDEVPDLFDLRLEPGDAIVLCSDGVWEPLRDDQIADALSAASLDEAMHTLCEQALAAGGTDNVTAVALRREPAA